MSRLITTLKDAEPQSPLLILEQQSLGYYIQGLAYLDNLIDQNPDHEIILEADQRLAPLVRRSFSQYENLSVVPVDPKFPRIPLPQNGKPQTAEEMDAYYQSKAADLASRLDIANYSAAVLLRPESAPPFNAHSLEDFKAETPQPGYLQANEEKAGQWIDYMAESDVRPILITWNKQYTQHGDTAPQNLDPSQTAELLYVLHEKGLEKGLRLHFYNAVHGVSADDLHNVNQHLPQHICLNAVKVPGTDTDFDLGQELDSYAALMRAVKDLGGGMTGTGNSYQHLFYAAETWHNFNKSSQVVVVPPGQSAIRRAWEIHGNALTVVAKSDDFAANPSDTLNRVAAATIACLPQI